MRFVFIHDPYLSFSLGDTVELENNSLKYCLITSHFLSICRQRVLNKNISRAGERSIKTNYISSAETMKNLRERFVTGKAENTFNDQTKIKKFFRFASHIEK